MADAYASNIAILLTGRNRSGGVELKNVSVPGMLATAGASAGVTTANSKYDGAALTFASNSPITVADNPTFRPTTGDLTMECWIYPTSLTQNFVIISKAAGTGLYPIQLSYVNGTGIAVRLFDSGGSLNNVILSTQLLTVNVWQHVAVTRNGNTFTLWYNGASVGTGTQAGALYDVGSNNWQIGAYDTTQFGLTGQMDDVCVTMACRYTAAFTPIQREVPPYPSAKLAVPPWVKVTTRMTGGAYIGARPSPAAKFCRDIYWGGNGKVTGFTFEDDSPDVPVRRRVRLEDEFTGITLREVWSDKTTGAFQFLYVDPSRKYTLKTYDHNHIFRAVIADNITPDPM